MKITEELLWAVDGAFFIHKLSQQKPCESPKPVTLYRISSIDFQSCLKRSKWACGSSIYLLHFMSDVLLLLDQQKEERAGFTWVILSFLLRMPASSASLSSYFLSVLFITSVGSALPFLLSPQPMSPTIFNFFYRPLIKLLKNIKLTLF